MYEEVSMYDKHHHNVVSQKIINAIEKLNLKNIIIIVFNTKEIIKKFTFNKIFFKKNTI